MSDGSTTPPGWYHAEGDPPGTQRYWDGMQWQGGPQPVATAAAAATRPPADLGARFVAFLIDAAIYVGIVIVAFAVGGAISAGNENLGGSIVVLGSLVAVGFWIWNWWIRQGRTGQSIGKQRQGIALLGKYDAAPVGLGRAFGRSLLGGVIDNLCLINTLWIFFDRDNQRLADKIFDVNVYRV